MRAKMVVNLSLSNLTHSKREVKKIPRNAQNKIIRSSSWHYNFKRPLRQPNRYTCKIPLNQVTYTQAVERMFNGCHNHTYIDIDIEKETHIQTHTCKTSVHFGALVFLPIPYLGRSMSLLLTNSKHSNTLHV